MSNWKDFELFVQNLLKKDNPILPKGSGSSKHEEDIVGSTTIAQCKFTENKNITILNKDLIRLIEASNLLEKFPLFFNRSTNENKLIDTLTIPINEKTSPTVQYIINLIILNNSLLYIQALIDEIKKSKSNTSLAIIKSLKKIMGTLLNDVKNFTSNIKDKSSKLEDDLEIIYKDLITVDLFGGN